MWGNFLVFFDDNHPGWFSFLLKAQRKERRRRGRRGGESQSQQDGSPWVCSPVRELASFHRLFCCVLPHSVGNGLRKQPHLVCANLQNQHSGKLRHVIKTNSVFDIYYSYFAWKQREGMWAEARKQGSSAIFSNKRPLVTWRHINRNPQRLCKARPSLLLCWWFTSYTTIFWLCERHTLLINSFKLKKYVSLNFTETSKMSLECPLKL